MKKVKPKEYTFKSLPRLLDMIEPTSKAKAYCQKLIDTLEKEGYTTDAKIVGECLKKMNGEDIPMAIMDEKHSEQKSNGKTERKFMVGDWITFYGSPAFKILKIEAEDNGILDYLLLNQNGHDSFYNKEYVDKNARLWTIYNAKDGDILVNKDGCIFIYNPNTSNNYLTLRSYCYLSIQGNFLLENYNTGSWLYADEVTPATKEQCDILFAKMREAGYIWDNNKKELMKKD